MSKVVEVKFLQQLVHSALAFFGSYRFADEIEIQFGLRRVQSDPLAKRFFKFRAIRKKATGGQYAAFNAGIVAGNSFQLALYRRNQPSSETICRCSQSDRLPGCLVGGGDKQIGKGSAFQTKKSICLIQFPLGTVALRGGRHYGNVARRRLRRRSEELLGKGIADAVKRIFYMLQHPNGSLIYVFVLYHLRAFCFDPVVAHKPSAGAAKDVPTTTAGHGQIEGEFLL